MAISTEKLEEYREYKLEFTPPPSTETRPETNDPFTRNEDGTIDLFVNGEVEITEKLKVEGNTALKSNLKVFGDLYLTSSSGLRYKIDITESGIVTAEPVTEEYFISSLSS